LTIGALHASDQAVAIHYFNYSYQAFLATLTHDCLWFHTAISHHNYVGLAHPIV